MKASPLAAKSLRWLRHELTPLAIFALIGYAATLVDVVATEELQVFPAIP